MLRREVLLPVVVSLFLGMAAASSLQAVPRASPQQTQITVYVTDTGKKYHVDGCRYLRKSRIPMKLAEAKKAGYDPCSVCKPPR